MRKMFRVGSYEVPKEDWESTPASVRELMVKIAKENEELREKVNKLEARLGQLEERLNQNSRNSSRPPSKDEPGKKKEIKVNQGEGRKRGRQKGHIANSNKSETLACTIIPNNFVNTCTRFSIHSRSF